MSGYDPDAILTDPNAHPIHKRYADISLLEWFFRPGMTHAEAAAVAVCGFCRARLTAGTAEQLGEAGERRGWHRTPAGSWYCVGCVTGDDGRQ